MQQLVTCSPGRQAGSGYNPGRLFHSLQSPGHTLYPSKEILVLPAPYWNGGAADGGGEKEEREEKKEEGSDGGMLLLLLSQRLFLHR